MDSGRPHDGPGRRRPSRVRRPAGADPPEPVDTGRPAPAGAAGANHRGPRPRRDGAGEPGRRSRRGSSDHPHGWLLAGRPPLRPRRDGAHRRVQCPPAVSPRALTCRGGSVARAAWSAPAGGCGWPVGRPSDVAGIGRRRFAGRLRRKMAGGHESARERPMSTRNGASCRADGTTGRRPAHGDDGAGLRCRAPDILDALHGALSPTRKWAVREEWSGYQDPFGDWHQDPCDDMAERVGDVHRLGQEGDDR